MSNAGIEKMTEASQRSMNMQNLLKKRYKREKRFRRMGITAVILSAVILLSLLISIGYQSLPAFSQSYVGLDIYFNAEKIDPDGTGQPESLREGNYRSLVRAALLDQFPEITSRRDKRQLAKLVADDAPEFLRQKILADPTLLGQTQKLYLTTSDDFDLLLKGRIRRDVPEQDRVLSDKEVAWIDTLVATGRVETRFARNLFFSGDSREPELAGVRGALVGTLLTMLVTFIASFPIGVMAATYLEELAPKNRFTDIIEVNINNLAAVPSIVFGLLGLAVFINFLNLPRSAPLVGGLVLALMTLPVIIISTRAALASVPPSIREAAMGVGASRLQVVLHHVLPLAMPGILTGTIIGLARAAGETAPLLMIGMMAFIVDTPQGVTDKATVLPAQIYMWANNPERAFEARTSAGIIILLIFLLLMNATAIYLRKRYEKRW